MADIYDKPVLVLGDGLVGVLHAAGDFNLIQAKPGEEAQLVGFNRDSAEMLATWLRVQLDKPQVSPPAGYKVEAPHADAYGKRTGRWDITVNVFNVPAGLRTPMAVQEEFQSMGLAWDTTTANVMGNLVTFKRCVGVPATMPLWAKCVRCPDAA